MNPRSALRLMDYDGPRHGPIGAILSLTRATVDQIWTIMAVRKTLLISWTLVVAMSGLAMVLLERLDKLPAALLVDPETGIERYGISNIRELIPQIWTIMLYSFTTATQSLSALFIIANASTRLIGPDLHSGAIQLYFSRPLSRPGYLIGKGAALWLYASLVTWIPFTVFYAMSLLMAPKGWPVFDLTWSLFLTALVWNTLVSLIIAVIALGISVISTNERVISYSWIAIVTGGFFLGQLQQLREFAPYFSLVHAINGLGLTMLDVPGVLQELHDTGIINAHINLQMLMPGMSKIAGQASFFSLALWCLLALRLALSRINRESWR